MTNNLNQTQELSMREKVEFIRGEHTLSGLLESPESDIKFYALFIYQAY